MKKIITFNLFVLSLTLVSFAQSATEIIQKADSARTYSTSQMDGEMNIHDRFGVKKVTFTGNSSGNTNTFIRFTSVEEQGQKILRTAKEVYVFYPDSEQLIRISGAALRDSLFGSDVSYEDLTADKKTTDNYDPELLGKENVDGKEAYKVRLTAKKGAEVAYSIQVWYVDTKNFLTLKGEYYSLSGQLLKDMTAQRVETVSGRPVVTAFTIRNVIRKNTFTEVHFNNMKLNVPLDPKIFSLDALKW